MLKPSKIIYIDENLDIMPKSVLSLYIKQQRQTSSTSTNPDPAGRLINFKAEYENQVIDGQAWSDSIGTVRLPFLLYTQNTQTLYGIISAFLAASGEFRGFNIFYCKKGIVSKLCLVSFYLILMVILLNKGVVHVL